MRKGSSRIPAFRPAFRPDALAFFRAKKAIASGRNVDKVFNPVLKLVFENYPFSCLSQLRSPHFSVAFTYAI